MAALLVIGAALRLWAYAADTSLILDEILLSRNILEAPLGLLLTQPLEHAQVAPRGFLLLERVAVLAFGSSEHALRLVPFLFSIAGLILFWRLAERTLDGLAKPFAVALFAVGIPFIKYAAEVKQYGIDATVAIALLLLALNLREREASTGRLVMAGLAGFLAILFSQASVLVMGGLGAALALEWVLSKDRRLWRPLVVTVPIWAAASVTGLVLGLRSMAPATRDYMYDYWRRGFLPLPPSPVPVLRWLAESATGFFTDVRLLNYPLPPLFVVLAAVGYWALWRRRRDVALLLLGPLVVAFAAAVAHQYPFRSRLLLFVLPSLVLALGAGAEWVRQMASRIRPALGAAMMLALLVPPVAVAVIAHPPYEIENYRAMLRYLQQKRQPGDVVYVLPPLREGMAFYGPRFGLAAADVTVSICSRNDTRPYVQDIDRFRGEPRVWFLGWSGGTYGAPRTAILRYLDAIGVRRDSLRLKSLGRAATDVDLFDLSDTTRLRAATAEAFPVPSMPTNSPRPWCSKNARSDSTAGVSQ